MEQHLLIYGILILLFDAFSLLGFDVDWHVESSAFPLEKTP